MDYTMRYMRLRRYVDAEMERLSALLVDLQDDRIRGRIDALRTLKVLYLLTPEEAADVEMAAREMGLR